ncbi:MAG: helix-turn-helix transcriptional regulator [Leptotrichiaceae bacterium]|nr:helix-turn-helix transcriptional regulator [Leptotrichiaceae bacterium]
MKEELLEKFRKITIEEKVILARKKIIKEIYTSQQNFIIESKKFLKNNKLIGMRVHTRFTYFPKHSHDYIDLIYMCRGFTIHIVNKEKIFLYEGEILLLNQNAVQEIFPAGKDDIAINFIIHPEILDDIFSEIGKGNRIYDFLVSSIFREKKISYLHFHTKDIQTIQNIIENIIRTILKNGSESNIINKFYIKILFLTLLENLDLAKSDTCSSEQYETDLLTSALKYIEINYKKGTLQEFAAMKKQTTYFISRLLKKYTNCNFKELIQKKKLERAEYLLTQTEVSIEMILSAIGYHNSSFFYKKFRKRYGMSPKNYRKKQNKEENKHK